jgi:ribosomal protein S18
MARGLFSTAGHSVRLRLNYVSWRGKCNPGSMTTLRKHAIFWGERSKVSPRRPKPVTGDRANFQRLLPAWLPFAVE